MPAWTKETVRSFLSGRWSGSARELLPLGIGIVLTGLALATAGQRIASVEKELRRQANPVEVVVASVPIAAGATFSDANLAKKAIPSSGAGRRNVPAGEFELLLGATARNPIDPGEPVLWTDVQEPYEADSFSALVRAGRRALTVSADASSSFAGLLVPGDRVDILAEAADAKASSWIPDLQVIAVDRRHDRIAGPAETGEAATVTLMVTPGEGARIARAAGSGRLHWFLRNPVDNSATTLRSPARWSAPLRVEIWKGGVKIPSLLPGSGSPG